MHVQKRYFKAFLLQLRQRMQHRVVLEGGGDDMLLALLFADSGGGYDGLVVRFAAAGRKQDLPGAAVEDLCDALPCALQGFVRLLPNGMQTGRVAVDLTHVGDHGVDGRLAHPCGRRIICVYVHVLSSFCGPMFLQKEYKPIYPLCQ